MKQFDPLSLFLTLANYYLFYHSVDAARVILRDAEKSGYINASFVDVCTFMNSVLFTEFIVFQLHQRCSETSSVRHCYMSSLLYSDACSVLPEL